MLGRGRSRRGDSFTISVLGRREWCGRGLAGRVGGGAVIAVIAVTAAIAAAVAAAVAGLVPVGRVLELGLLARGARRAVAVGGRLFAGAPRTALVLLVVFFLILVLALFLFFPLLLLGLCLVFLLLLLLVVLLAA